MTKVHEAKGLDDVPNLTGKTYKPSGGTALLDAVAVGICQGEIELRKAKGQEERVVVIIMTGKLAKFWRTKAQKSTAL